MSRRENRRLVPLSKLKFKCDPADSWDACIILNTTTPPFLSFLSALERLYISSDHANLHASFKISGAGFGLAARANSEAHIKRLSADSQ